MVQAIDKYFPEGTKHTFPDGGYYVWAELPGDLDVCALAPRVAREINVCYGNGDIFYSEGNQPGMGRNCMRLNFSGQTEETIDKYFRLLGDYFKNELKKQEGSVC